MSRVVLGAADDGLVRRVGEATDGDVHVLPPGRLPADPARLFEQLPDGELPDVLLIGPLAPPEEVFTLAARLDVRCPGISVVLLASPTAETWQAAMRAGVRDLLPPTADAGEIRAAVERAGSSAAIASSSWLSARRSRMRAASATRPLRWRMLADRRARRRVGSGWSARARRT